MPLGLVEMIAVFSIVLAFAIYQLITVRRTLSTADDDQPSSKRTKEPV